MTTPRCSTRTSFTSKGDRHMVTTTNGRALMKRLLAGLALLAALAALSVFMGLGEAADHRDGPIFGPPGTTSANGRADINDVYVFQSPANGANTVLILDVSPFPGVLTPTT